MANPLSAVTALPAGPLSPGSGGLLGGLTSDEARGRLEKFGPNAMPDTSMQPLRMALEKFWAPVPRMLEAAIMLELVLGKYVEAAIIAALLVFNAALGLLQESRAAKRALGRSPRNRRGPLVFSMQVSPSSNNGSRSFPRAAGDITRRTRKSVSEAHRLLRGKLPFCASPNGLSITQNAGSNSDPSSSLGQSTAHIAWDNSAKSYAFL